jgi:beta-1,4-N-acetylglucosaminyltransferase
MLFVTVGTTDFDLLIQSLDELAPRLHEDVVCQIGRGHYVPRHCRHFRFAPSLADEITRARVVVSHGGQGSILEAVKAGKPLVAVSNPDRRDHHQDDILARFAELNLLIWCRSVSEVRLAIEQASRTRFAAYVEPDCAIHTVIDDFLTRSESTARRRQVSRIVSPLAHLVTWRS